MKVLNIVGARPNFVKIAPLMEQMRQHIGIDPVLVHTGQHYDLEMSDSFFRDLEIPRPDYHLHVKPGSSASQVSEIIARLEPVVLREQPEVVLVVGDVNSTLAGALTAVKLGIPVAHVEAGLRSFDRTMPEETNRVVTDAISDLLFVSEPSGVENLLREGRPSECIFLVGNVMIDTLRRALAQVRSNAPLPIEGFGAMPSSTPRYGLLTLHRQGLVDNGELFRKVWTALEDIGREIPLIFPAHPRTRDRLARLGLQTSEGNGHAGQPVLQGIHTVAPLGYLDFLRLQQSAAFVLTDSGGVQEETSALGVPCLTLRENTERPLTVTEGTNKVVGLSPERIRHSVREILRGTTQRGRSPALWDGHAAERIVHILSEHSQSGAGKDRAPREFIWPASVSSAVQRD